MLLIGPVENLCKSRGIGGKKPRKNEKKSAKMGKNGEKWGKKTSKKIYVKCSA
jgi:hypothetical protein